MATGAADANGIWIYGEDDNESTHSALLNKLGSSTSTQIGVLKQPGRIVQVVSATKIDSFATSSSTPVDVTGLTVTITPKSSSNKVLIRVLAYTAYTNVSYPPALRIVRNGTAIANDPIGIPYGATTAGGSTVAYEFLDSPASTSALTYKLQISNSASTTVYVGRYGAGDSRSIGSIVAMEVTA